MIQVMENAWVDLQLSGFRDLPMNRGWMGVFRRWASTPALRSLWPILRGEYGQDFVKFCETELELGARIDPVLYSRLDAAFFDDAKKILGQEFAREWPQENSLDVLIRGAKETWSGWADQQPIAPIIQAPPGEEDIAKVSDKIACGITFLSRLSAGDPDHNRLARFEVFIWMRRAYRGMGIASRGAAHSDRIPRDCQRNTSGSRLHDPGPIPDQAYGARACEDRRDGVPRLAELLQPL